MEGDTKFQDMLEALPKHYRKEIIDGEYVVYCKYSEKYDVEVSGLNKAPSRRKIVNIYLWENGSKIKEIISLKRYNSHNLKRVLYYFEAKYLHGDCAARITGTKNILIEREG